MGFSFAFPPLLIWCGIFSYAYWLNCFSSFLKFLCRHFVHFSVMLFFILICRSSLFWILKLCHVANSSACLSFYFPDLWWLEIALIAKLTVLPFMVILCVLFKKFFPTLGSERYISDQFFISFSFKVLFFTFNSLILLKLLYVWYEVRIHFTSFSPVWIACYASTVYWLILPFSTDLRFLLPQFSILSHWSVLSVSVPVSYCFNYDSFKINHEPDSSLHPLLLIPCESLGYP